jgi:hypothetical protein
LKNKASYDCENSSKPEETITLYARTTRRGATAQFASSMRKRWDKRNPIYMTLWKRGARLANKRTSHRESGEAISQEEGVWSTQNQKLGPTEDYMFFSGRCSKIK